MDQQRRNETILPDQPPSADLKYPETTKVAVDMISQFEQVQSRLISVVLKTHPDLKKDDLDDATLKGINDLASEQAARITELKESQKQVTHITEEIETLQKQAAIDSLTGIYNRVGFEREALKALDNAWPFIKTQNAERPSEKRLVHLFVAFDIDKFKNINDQGKREHDEGDDVLRSVGEKLRKTVRPTDLAARVGGDEFCILFLNVPADEIEKIMTRVVTALRAITYERKNGQERINIDISAGVKIIEADEAPNLEKIKNEADETAGLAKLNKNTRGYLICDAHSKEKVVHDLEAELTKPIEETSRFQSLLREHQRHLEDVRNLLSPEQANMALARLKEQAREELGLALAKLKRG